MSTPPADDELAPGFRVEVKQDIGVEDALFQVVGAIHARLFVGGDERLDGAVLQVFGFHHSHDGCDAQPVVCAQRGAFGLNPVAVYISLNGVGLKAVLAVGCLLGHHVHVGLQHYCLACLHSWCSGLAHDDVVAFVLEGFNSGLCGEVQEKLLYSFQMTRWTGNLGEGVEMLPNALGCQILNLTHDILVLS